MGGVEFTRINVRQDKSSLVRPLEGSVRSGNNPVFDGDKLKGDTTVWWRGFLLSGFLSFSFSLPPFLGRVRSCGGGGDLLHTD